jgi:hypothetical protein
MAPIIRGADTDRHDFSPYSAGLWAISSGLSYNILDDHQLLAQGASFMMRYMLGRVICKRPNMYKVAWSVS